MGNVPKAQSSFTFLYDGTEIPEIGDWMLTLYGPGQVESVMIPVPIPERFLEIKQKIHPGQTHWYADKRNPENGYADMYDEEGNLLTDLSVVVAVRYRSSAWNYFRLTKLTKWDGKHQYNEGPIG